MQIPEDIRVNVLLGVVDHLWTRNTEAAMEHTAVINISALIMINRGASLCGAQSLSRGITAGVARWRCRAASLSSPNGQSMVSGRGQVAGICWMEGETLPS
jgi:hypothetical protein